MLAELKYAYRALRAAPAFTLTSIATLALGIGATTAIFSIVNAVVLRPLAFDRAGELAAVRCVIPSVAQKYPTLPVNARFYEEWKTCSAFSDLAVVDETRVTLNGVGDSVRLPGAYTSPNLLAALRVVPELGRFFLPDEIGTGKPRVAVISHALWQTRLAGDPAVIGRTVTLNQRPVTIVGVLPPDFRLPGLGGVKPIDVVLPITFTPEVLSEVVGRFNYEVIGRLAPGITTREAEAQLNVIATRLSQLAEEKVEIRSSVIPLQTAVAGEARRGLWLLLGAVAVVLALACLNLGILGLARSERRTRELAVRAALGASWRRLLGQSLAETLLLAVAGGALGCVVAVWSLSALVAIAPQDLPRLNEARVDGSVLLFSIGATLGATILAGLVPAWYSANRGVPGEVLAGAGSTRVAGGATAGRARAIFVGVEVAVSTVLLALAGLLLASFSRVLRADVGVHAPQVMTTRVSIARSQYRENADILGYYQRMLAAVAAVPGVEAAAVTNRLPLNGEVWISAVHLPGDDRPTFQQPPANVRFVSPDYFRTFGIKTLAGRTLREDDGTDALVISSRLAQTLWPNGDAVGRKVIESGAERTVVGVVADVRTDVDQPAVAVVYHVPKFWPSTELALAVRVNPAQRLDLVALRGAILSVDPLVPIEPVRTLDDLFAAGTAPRRFQLRLVGAFALTALLLAAIGIYGVVAHSVTSRTRELGIRLALGALPRRLVAMLLQQNVTPIAIGLVAGLAGALAGGSLLASLLYETNPRDPATLVVVAVGLLALALLACWLPARRAAKVDPVVALRAE